MAIQTGIRGQKKFVVNEDMIASRLGSGLVNVFGTPAMIAAIENTAAMSVQPLLEEGKTTVGISLNVSHVAATPLGMEVRVETELTELAPRDCTHDEVSFRRRHLPAYPTTEVTGIAR